MSFQESGSGRRGYHIHRAMPGRQDGQQRSGENHVAEKGGLDNETAGMVNGKR